MDVLKFGGSSVATPDRIRHVARIIETHRRRGSVAVVVSAMGDTTDDLLQLAQQVSPHFDQATHRRELDMLLTTGERVSMSLLAMSLLDLGVPAASLTGSQSGILTDTTHGDARIVEIRPKRVQEILDSGRVAIVAGFQGVSAETKEITTLGRGGSDTSAVALGHALGAKEVFIYTDVDGVFETDPRLMPSARLIPELPLEMALGASRRGAVVLHPRCVETALQSGVNVRVLSSLKACDLETSGTRLLPFQPDKHSGHAWMWTLETRDQVSRLSVFGRDLKVPNFRKDFAIREQLDPVAPGFESSWGEWNSRDLEIWVQAFRDLNNGLKS